jgi:hypothetical protein
VETNQNPSAPLGAEKEEPMEQHPIITVMDVIGQLLNEPDQRERIRIIADMAPDTRDDFDSFMKKWRC